MPSIGQHELTNSQSISVLEFKNINGFHTGDYYCSTQDKKMVLTLFYLHISSTKVYFNIFAFIF